MSSKGSSKKAQRHPRTAFSNSTTSSTTTSSTSSSTSTSSSSTSSTNSRATPHEPASASSTGGALGSPAPDALPCLICVDPILVYAVGECNHRSVCAVCAFRMRHLYKDTSCCVCKAKLGTVVFTTLEDMPYAELLTLPRSELHFLKSERIWFHGQMVHARFLSLLAFRCRLCKEHMTSLKALKKHVRHEHALTYCDVCLRDRKVFLTEQVLYDLKEIRRHFAGELPQDKAIIGKGHPLCHFCSQHFFDDEHLFLHMDKNHLACDLCTRAGREHQYFVNYDSLEEHFDSDHYLCHEERCLARKFVVFNNAMELKAHNVSVHLNDKPRSRSKKKKMTSLSVAELHEAASQTRPNASQRNSSSGRSFRGSATSATSTTSANSTPTASSTASSSSSAPSTANGSSESPANGFDGGQLPEHAREVIKQAAKLRNEELIKKMKRLLRTNEDFERFRQLSGHFRVGRMPPAQYYTIFRQMFGWQSQADELFEELVSLLPDGSKRSELERAARTLDEIHMSGADERRAMTTYSSAWQGNGDSSQVSEGGEKFPQLPTAQPGTDDGEWDEVGSRDNSDGPQGGKAGRKKKKKKGQVLLHFG